MSTVTAKGVWVLIEQENEKLIDGSLELVGEGRKVADKLNEGLTVVVPGDIAEEQVGLLAQHGAERILCLEHPALNPYSVEVYSQVLSDVIEERAPSVVLAVGNINGTDLACRVAARLGTGLVTSCDRVDVNTEGQLVQVKPIYGAKAAATCICPADRPQMATVNLDALELKTPDTGRTAEVEKYKPDTKTEKPNIQNVGFIKGDPKAIDLTEADIVVAGGMGFSTQENFRLIDELADVIGGSVAATRRVVDEEWTTLSRQIGLTGKTVRPKLYIACGISGAIQHTMGMKDSKLIVAINTDRNALIFKIADVGVVGDVMQVVPELTAQLREAMAQGSKSSGDDSPEAVSDAKN
jgi:electron transfer flavoprotein alpha subunit